MLCRCILLLVLSTTIEVIIWVNILVLVVKVNVQEIIVELGELGVKLYTILINGGVVGGRLCRHIQRQ